MNKMATDCADVWRGQYEVHDPSDDCNPNAVVYLTREPWETLANFAERARRESIRLMIEASHA